MRQSSRRDFMKVATSYLVGAAGLLGLAGIGRYLSYDSGPRRRTEFDLGAADAFPVGSRTRIDEIPALILHDAEGFIAISLQCTHLGCAVDDVLTGFECPCHGSQYDVQGQVTRGPARQPLPRLRTQVTADGNLVVYTN